MGNGWFPPWPTWPGEGEPDEQLEDRMAEEAVGFIRRHAYKPFFLQYLMFETHGPWK